MPVAIKGIAELTQKLKSLQGEIREEAEQNLVKWGAQLFAREAKKRVPTKTGTLKKSIRVMKDRPGLVLKKKQWSIGQGIIRYIVSPTRGGKNADGFYAHLVEFGTSAHEIKPKRKKAMKYGDEFSAKLFHPGFHQKPFMRPAFDENADAAITAMGRRLNKWLERKAKA